jgi:Na+/H+ antiporter NhaC
LRAIIRAQVFQRPKSIIISGRANSFSFFEPMHCFAQTLVGLLRETGCAARVLDNISGFLKSEGLSLGDVLKTTIFLTDLGNFQIVNEIYGSYFPNQPPARSTVQVSALPKARKSRSK